MNDQGKPVRSPRPPSVIPRLRLTVALAALTGLAAGLLAVPGSRASGSARDDAQSRIGAYDGTTTSTAAAEAGAGASAGAAGQARAVAVPGLPGTAAPGTPTAAPHPPAATPAAHVATRPPAAASSTAPAAAASGRRSYPELRVDPWTLFSSSRVWVGYGFVQAAPSDFQVAQDFAQMRQFGITGVITYRADNSWAGMAARAGLQVILGVAKPTNQLELLQATGAANAGGSTVQAIVVGNEGLTFHLYTADQVSSAMQQIRGATHLPVATSEPDEFNPDLGNDPAVTLGDFVFPNLQPFYIIHSDGDPKLNPDGSCASPRDNPVRQAAWTQQQLAKYAPFANGRPVWIHETGMSTQGDCRSDEQTQKDYVCALHHLLPWAEFFTYVDSTRNNALFGGNYPEYEYHWGVVRADRSEKPAARFLAGGC